MTGFLFVAVLAPASLTAGICIIVPKGRRAKSIARLLALYYALVSLYLLFPPFGNAVDAVFKGNERHFLFVVGNMGDSIPLPPKSRFVYKWNNSTKVYSTMINEEKIVEFFSNLDDSGEGGRVWSEGKSTFMSFACNQDFFVVEIKKASFWKREYTIAADRDAYGHVNNIRLVDIMGRGRGSLWQIFGNTYFACSGDVYERPEQGIRFFFGDDDKIHTIVCGEGADINGVRLGMSISEVEGVLGKEYAESENDGVTARNYKYKYHMFLFTFSEDGHLEGAAIRIRSSIQYKRDSDTWDEL